MENQNKNNFPELKQGFTHAGVFHADDVFSTALLQILNPEIKIYRGYTVPEQFEGIVYDIGGGKFDHHQKNKRCRNNGTPYAAFGLIWETYGKEILGEEAKRFDEDFIETLDWTDNFGGKHSLSQAIADRNPVWYEKEPDIDAAFFDAVRFAKEILDYRFNQIRAKLNAAEIVQEKANACSGKILYLDQAMPWKEAIKGFDIVYVIFPSSRGGYCIQAVPDDEKENVLKKPFPEEWRGSTAEELKQMTGIQGISFCHTSGFLATAETLEEARQVANLSLAQEQVK